jgi:hypothetical protein
MICNYLYADTKLRVANTETDADDPKPGKTVTPVIPASCSIRLGTGIIDLLEELRKKRSSRKERMFLNYHQIKKALGHRLTYKESTFTRQYEFQGI